jgi:hypothetical protein
MEQELNQLELKTEGKTSLAIVEMLKTLSWHLADKPLPRNLLPKVYWNKETQVVYVDAAGLEPQKEWCIKFGP